MRSVLSRLRLRSQAAMVPARVEFSGLTLLTMKQLVAPPFDGLGDDLLGAAFAIELGGVDQRHAEIEPELKRRDLFVEGAPAFAHAPGALAELRHCFAGRKRDGGKSGTMEA